MESATILVADYVLNVLNVGLDELTEVKQAPEAITPPNPQPSFGPLAPNPPLTPQERGVRVNPTVTPAPEATSQDKPAQPAEQSDVNNADALNVLSEEDIERIIEQTRQAEEAEQAQ